MRACRLVVAGSVAALAASGGAAAERNLFDYFRTPSGNILCGYARVAGTPPFLRCEIRSGLRPRPPRPRNCSVDWGFGLTVGRAGRAAVLCAGDTVASRGARVLGYGTTWRRDGFACTSRRTGLTCTNPQQHGFFLSRERWRRF